MIILNRSLSSLLFVLFWIGVSNLPAQAQIGLGGLAEVELRKGGDDSSPYVNQTPNKNWSIYTPTIRLFVNGVLSDKLFVSSVLQADYYTGEELSPVFFSVINANWMPLDDSGFTITAGRFVTPYGTYSERLLSSENPFVHLPLSHASGLPVSKIYGVLSDEVDYEAVTGLTMIYQRMYSQGIRVSNAAEESAWFRYTVAATMAPAASHFETGEHNTPSLMGRITLHPAIWGRLGLSFSTGPFMKRDETNGNITDSDFSSYTQSLTGIDLQLSYRYYTFLAEYNRSRWKLPYIDNSGTVMDDNLEASAQHVAVETIINFPFWVGGYAAVRYEILLSGDLSSYTGNYSAPGDTWTYDRERIDFTAGYKFQRNALLKFSYLYSTDNGPGLEDDVITLQLSLGF